MEALKRYLKDYAYLVLISGTVIVLDQITKGWVESSLAMGEIWSPWDWLTPYARIVHWANTGVAFGMFQNLGTLFTFLPILVAGLIIYFYIQVPREEWSLRLAMSLQLGGALGNLIDRLSIGHVTDFISVGNFPVFNIADSAITIGVGVLLLGMYLQERAERNKPVDEPSEDDEKPASDGSAFQDGGIS